MQGGSLGSSGRKLDVRNEGDALALLQIVRGSALDPVSKDEIRDLVFALRSNFDQETLQTLAVHTAPLAVTVVGVEPESEAAPAAATDTTTTPTTPAEAASDSPAPEASEPAPDAPDAAAASPRQSAAGFPSRRPTPQFAPSSTGGAPTPAAAPSTADHQTDAPTAPPQPAAAAQPAPQTDTPKPPVTDAATSPASEQQPAELAAHEQNITPDSAAPAVPATDIKQRIDEIKHAVNAQVGNPVNLIDATNEVGREYMNALLEAMKAVQGGGDSAAAMQRLESAYTAVEEALRSGNTAAATKAESEPEPDTGSATEPTPAATSPAAPAAPPPSEPEAKKSTAPTEPVESPAEAPAAKKATSEPPTASAAAAPLTSVAAATIETVEDKMPEPEEPPAPTDSLQSEAVTNGLKQLLSEWKLFKSGGLLGTGPKGIDHPLYQELKNTPMNLVIAGRFEGATPEVKQSIHDYMNGWRYEQGMTHDLKETFEHYLRRVVKTIIDKQAKSQ